MLSATLSEWLLGVIGIIALLAAGMCWFVTWELVGRSPRRLAWIVCGLAGLPAVFIGVLYALLGLPIIVGAAVLGVVASLNHRLTHLPAALYATVFLGAGVLDVSTQHLRISEAMRTFVFLGRVAGQATFTHETGAGTPASPTSNL